jgi:hypothetical protein
VKRNPINVFYYPDFLVHPTTLKKSILLFDQIHVMDRPSFTFGFGFGSIGADSPLKAFEQAFRNDGVELYVHGINGGRVDGQPLDDIKADISDVAFLNAFQAGIKTSPIFREKHVPKGNYGLAGSQEEVAETLATVDLVSELRSSTPEELFEGKNIPPFDLSTNRGAASQLIRMAALCSAQINVALNVNAREGFYPLADSLVYGELFRAKYARAINKLSASREQIPITDLSFSIFDELVSTSSIENMSIKDIINYRKRSATAREEFLEHISVLQAKQGAVGINDNYAGTIDRVVKTEILPAAKKYRDALKNVNEALVGKLATGVMGFVGGNGLLNFMGDISLNGIIGLAGAASAYTGIAAGDALVKQRSLKRECSISYLLTLE